jgi:hypothetical protein
MEESWTTLPVVEPEKNSTVILTEPSLFAALSERSSACCTAFVDAAATDAGLPAVTDRPIRLARMTSPIRALLEATGPTGTLTTDAR